MANHPDGGPARARPWHRLFPALGGGVVGAGAVLLVLLLTGDGEGGGRGAAASSTTAPPSTTTSVAPAPGVTTTVPVAHLSPAAQELARLADKGRALEFHARYQARDVRSRSGQLYTVDLELWNEPPQVRRDLAIANQGQRVLSSDIRTDKLVLRCGKPSEPAAWQCATLPIGAPNDPGGTAYGLAPGALSGRPVTVRDETVADRPARCFSLEGGEGPAAETLCLSRDGIPLRVTSGAAVLELASLELSVGGEGVFEPPARPVGA